MLLLYYLYLAAIQVSPSHDYTCSYLLVRMSLDDLAVLSRLLTTYSSGSR